MTHYLLMDLTFCDVHCFTSIMCVCVCVCLCLCVPLMFFFFFTKGRLCVSAIGNAFNTLNLYIEDKSQWAMLDEKFKSVHWLMLYLFDIVINRLSPKLESFEDSELLTLNLAGIFMDVVQYNNDSRGEVSDLG